MTNTKYHIQVDLRSFYFLGGFFYGVLLTSVSIFGVFTLTFMIIEIIKGG